MKENLQPDEVLVYLDFYENYNFIIQDEPQSYHWNKTYLTIHPVVIYYHANSIIHTKSYCFISDDLEHDSSFVNRVQFHLLNILREMLPQLKKVHYVSDGCAA